MASTPSESSSPASSPRPFEALGLSAVSQQLVDQAGYLQPTPIQTKAIPHVLADRDVIGCASTGTGKTAAFMLPIIERICAKRLTRALVLVPTRELANQIAEHAERFGGPRQVRCATLIGGVGMGGQIAALKAQPQLIIATPGRLIDHLDQKSVSLANVDALVLDEADRMLDMGFKPQLVRILSHVPRRRQTLLFSATMAGEVHDFARGNLHQPVRVEVSPSGTTAARAAQRVYEVQQTEKTALLVALLGESQDSTLVFTRTKRRADKVARWLARTGTSVDRIHADRSQTQRERALEGFRNGQCRVLVATDIAARGIDVADIGHVVIYDLPHVAADYVHRVGRTARAQSSGRATSFVAPDEAHLLTSIERLTKVRLPRERVPRESQTFQAQLQAEKSLAPSGGQSHGRRRHHRR